MLHGENIVGMHRLPTPMADVQVRYEDTINKYSGHMAFNFYSISLPLGETVLEMLGSALGAVDSFRFLFGVGHLTPFAPTGAIRRSGSGFDSAAIKRPAPRRSSKLSDWIASKAFSIIHGASGSSKVRKTWLLSWTQGFFVCLIRRALAQGQVVVDVVFVSWSSVGITELSNDRSMALLLLLERSFETHCSES